MARFQGVLLALGATAAFAASAAAQFSIGPLPTNAYIVFDGLDWAWASPLPADFAGGGFTLAGESAYGWALPTPEQLADAPDATDFLFAGGNVPFNGTDVASGATFEDTDTDYDNAASDGACATPWFSDEYYHCDFDDGQGEFGPWAGADGADPLADQLVVRADVASVTPEPATMSMLAMGLLGLAGARKRRRRNG